MEDHRRRDDAEVRDVDQQRKTAKVNPDRGRVDPLKSEKFQEAHSRPLGRKAFHIVFIISVGRSVSALSSIPEGSGNSPRGLEKEKRSKAARLHWRKARAPIPRLYPSRFLQANPHFPAFFRELPDDHDSFTPLQI